MNTTEELNDIVSKLNFKDGALLLIDKPFDWTSFDVVKLIRANIRSCLKLKCKVGHAGTLDPRATGLLMIATGKKTKQIETFQGLDKGYKGTLKLGATTPCYDAEMEENATFPTEHITEEMLYEHTEKFIGSVHQTVPIYSAVKVDGKKLYKLARAGQEVRAKSRTININRFKIEKIEMPLVHFHVDCSKGTYIRSLAHDFGKSLQSGAYLTALQRTNIGPYHLDEAWELDAFIKAIRRLKAV